MDKEILIIFSSFANLLLGAIVYRKERKALNASFFLFAISISLWSMALFFYTHPLLLSALEWIKITYFFSSIIVITGLRFVAVFADVNRDRIKRLMRWYLALITPLIFILFFTNLWVKDVITVSSGFHTLTGPAYLLFAILIGFYTFLCFNPLYQKYRASTGTQKLQFRYIFMGFVLFGIPAFVVDVFLPISIGTSQYFWMSPLFSFFLVAFTTLAILRYHLFEVRVIMTEILVVVMGSVLLALTFFMETTRLKLLTLSAFLLFCIFGYLLIKTTHIEIRRREEMEKLTKRLRKAYKNIKDLSQMKTEFLKVVGHQLRTPVSIIRGLVSMLEEGGVSRDKEKKYIGELYLTSERLTTILEDILVAQRLVAEEYKVEPAPCDAAELLKNITEQFEPMAAKKHLKLIIESPKEKIFKLSMDEETVEKIVSRLVDNAILYTSVERGGKKEIVISFNTSKEGRKKFIAISVQDSGIGLNEHDKKNLFKLFFRGKRAVYVRPNGSGLGLFIVKKLAEAHGGRIKVESKGRGKGSTFTLILPV